MKGGKMKQSAFSILGAALLLLAASPPASDETAAADAASRFATRLKTALSQSIQEGGFSGAIEVCHIQAPKIAEDISRETGMRIRRVSLKARNVSNRPDPWEIKVLREFETLLSKGDPPESLVRSEIVESGKTREFRYMKGIVTQGLCLNCHGKEIPAEVKTKLEELYPDDGARGHQVGDLRGAFSLRKNL